MILMAKPFKKLSATGLAAALVASSIVPAVSAETPAAAPAVQDVVVKQDGKLISISMDDYSTLLGAGKTPEIAFITLNNGETFDIEQFGDALGATLELNKALTYLADEATPATPENVLTGSVDEKGNIVADQTPEEKVNETFFYNLAA